MKPPAHDLTRWRAQGDDSRPPEARAAILVAAASDAPGLDQRALARVRRAVLAQQRRRLVGDFWRFPVGVRFALLAGLMVLSITTAGAASLLWQRYRAPRSRLVRPAAVEGSGASIARPSRARPHEPPRAPRQVAAAVGVPVAPPARASHASLSLATRSGMPSPEPAVAANQDRVRGPRQDADAVLLVAGRPERPAVAATVATTVAARVEEQRPDFTASASRDPYRGEPPPPTETEAGLLAEAISALRSRHDPRAALSTLARYDQRFPHGAMASEALSARLEAVIQLDDLKAALALLDGLDVVGGMTALSDPVAADRLLMRAELRAGSGRYRDALTDFTRILDSGAGVTAGLRGERALYGRAICWARMGQGVHARADLVAYRRLYPRGRFAFEVARLLDDPGVEPDQAARP